MHSMFARSACRAARPLRMQGRRHYASENAPSKSSSSSAFAWIAGGAAVGIAGYLYRTNSSPAAAASNAAAAAVPAKPAFTGGDQGFVSLKLSDVEIVNHNTKRFRFELPEKDMVSGLHVASAMLTKYKGPNDEKATIRPYTPVSDEGERGFLDLIVKKYPDGPMSTHLHNMVPGQRLDFKGPLPKYPWTENKHDHIALVAGGTGISPMHQLCRAIFNNPNDKTKVTLVFGNIAEEDILLKREFEDLENTYPQRFRAFYVLEKAPKEWGGGRGYINKELLKTVLPEAKNENIKVFVCGPPGMMKVISGPKVSPKDQGEVSGILKELGYTSEQVYKF